MNMPVQNGSRASIRRHLRWGLFLVVLLAGGLGGWATMAGISSAVIAPGSVVVDTNVKKVQHPDGGIVGEIRARDGDQVKAGDILVRLDAVVTRSKLAIVNKNLTELTARKARLEAERDAAEAITFPTDLLNQSDEPEVAHAVAGETKLFELRRAARIGQKAQLRKRIAQRSEEITGIEAQVEAKTQEIVLVQRELDGKRRLWEKKLVLMGNLTELEREATRMKGEKAGLIATIARARGRIAETELQIIQIDRELGSEVAMELREVDARISEYLERKAVAEDALKRIDIRAPQDGMVHQSTVHTVGGVISAGEAIMLIVPEADNLMVEAKVAPRDIDQLYLGQSARLSFSAFNQRTTPSISGTVMRISPDTTTDERSGQSDYTVRIAMEADEISRLGSVTLVSGMPVEVFVQTGERTVLTYLVQPLSDQITRAFREQ